MGKYGTAGSWTPAQLHYSKMPPQPDWRAPLLTNIPRVRPSNDLRSYNKDPRMCGESGPGPNAYHPLTSAFSQSRASLPRLQRLLPMMDSKDRAAERRQHWYEVSCLQLSGRTADAKALEERPPRASTPQPESSRYDGYLKMPPRASTPQPMCEFAHCAGALTPTSFSRSTPPRAFTPIPRSLSASPSSIYAALTPAPMPPRASTQYLTPQPIRP